MPEIVQNLEQLVAQVRPLVVAGAGLAAAIIGLVVWLAGLRFKYLLSAGLGAAAGCACAFIVTKPAPAVLAVCGVAGGLIGLLVHRIFLSLLAAVALLATSFIVLLGPAIRQTQNFTQAMQQVPCQSWLILAALTLALLVAAVYRPRFTTALSAATIGTILLWTGMTLLLSYKGSHPFQLIGSSRTFCAAAALAMVAFGTTAQLFLCKPPTAKSTSDKSKDEQKQQSQTEQQNWRNV